MVRHAPRLLACLLAAAALDGDSAGPQARRKRDLTEISLEELMKIEVTSAARKEQKLSQVAAAVFVITQEDIRRSGATSIPEALRMAPGLQVARISGSKWAITARGFNAQFANKLLVLIDGRSVYSPLFSGVYWDVQDTLLEDVDRIEVIRGPGATMWGANAVNGVINIITKPAARTQGVLVTAGAGDRERLFGGLRYGGSLGARGHYRVFSKYFNRDDHLTETGAPAGDDWSFLRGGFRMDLNVSRGGALTLQGDIYRGRVAQRIALPTRTPPFYRSMDEEIEPSGGNLLGRWTRASSRATTTAQFYYDRTARQEMLIGEELNLLDAELHQQFRAMKRHELMWGLGHRQARDRIANRVGTVFDPRRTDHLYSAVVADEIEVAEDRLQLTLGSQFEHNSFSGFEAQPTLRLAWTPHPRHAAWGALSRAVRTPSPVDRQTRFETWASNSPLGIPMLVLLSGTPDFGSEEIIASELGYRCQAAARLSFDVTGFHHRYQGLRATVAGQPQFSPAPVPHLEVPASFRNGAGGASWGLEAAAFWNPVERWKLSGSYSSLAMRIRPYTQAMIIQEGDYPAQQFNVRSFVDVTRNVQFDAALYWVGRFAEMRVPSYTRVDARVGWRPRSGLEVNLTGQNLTDPRHPEFAPEGIARTTEIGRGIYGSFTWRFW